MKITAQKLTQDIKKKNFASVYLFYGEEPFIIEKYVQDIIKNALEPGNEDFNLDILYGNEVDGAKIVNIAMSYPMMTDKRVVLVKNIHLLKTASLELLLKYIQNPSKTTCLLLTCAGLSNKHLKEIDKICTSFYAKPLYDNQIPEWIQDYLADKKMTITNEALRLLHASTGNSLQNLSMEIEKILLNIGERERIETADVEAVVGTSKLYNVFELCDSVGFKKLQVSIHILNHLLQLGESPGLIISMLNRHFTRLLITKELNVHKTNEQEMARVLKVHHFFVRNYIRQAGFFNNQQLKKAFTLLLETDELLKSSSQKPSLLLELLLIKLNYII
ncbi:DNA polymerase III subunit delta [candidate division KSB1 bacterium]|nr:DNA polymerase III subunit delta [candidate division KSB1 bacterium]